MIPRTEAADLSSAALDRARADLARISGGHRTAVLAPLEVPGHAVPLPHGVAGAIGEQPLEGAAPGQAPDAATADATRDRRAESVQHCTPMRCEFVLGERSGKQPDTARDVEAHAAG